MTVPRKWRAPTEDEMLAALESVYRPRTTEWIVARANSPWFRSAGNRISESRAREILDGDPGISESGARKVLDGLADRGAIVRHTGSEWRALIGYWSGVASRSVYFALPDDTKRWTEEYSGRKGAQRSARAREVALETLAGNHPEELAALTDSVLAGLASGLLVLKDDPESEF